MTQKTTRLTEHEVLAFHKGLPRTWVLWTLAEEFQRSLCKGNDFTLTVLAFLVI